MHRSQPLLAACWLAAASAIAPPLVAQGAHQHTAMGPASSATASTITLQVRVDSARQEMVIELGPVDLPAAGHHVETGPREDVIPVAGWLRGMRVELVDSDGRPVPQLVLHHVNIIAPERRELFSNIMLRLGAAGHETAPFTMPRALGYRVAGGERLLVTAMMHNPTQQDYRGVTLRVVMPYIPASTLRRPMGVMPFYLDVMPPAGIHAYDLPPGYSEQSWEGRPALSGRVLGMGGHVHKHALSLRLEDVTEGRVIWERKPVVDENGEVKAMPPSMFPFGLRLRADHVYRLKAIYDNPTGATIPDGGMGALGGIFVPDGALPWPAADPANPEYQLDVKTVREGLAGRTKPGGHQH